MRCGLRPRGGDADGRVGELGLSLEGELFARTCGRASDGGLLLGDVSVALYCVTKADLVCPFPFAGVEVGCGSSSGSVALKMIAAGRPGAF